MKEFPNRELIEDISLELGVEPAFIEKDKNKIIIHLSYRLHLTMNQLF
jgi:hypothetical protein